MNTTKTLTYRCGKCAKIHKFRIDAVTCCAPEPVPVWQDNDEYLAAKIKKASKTWANTDADDFVRSLRN